MSLNYSKRLKVAAKALFALCPPAPPVPTPVPTPTGTKDITIAIMNRSTVVTDSQLQPVVAALQKQVSNDFAPVWGIDAQLVFVGLTDTPPSGAWQLGIFDNSDTAGALGYHDITQEGMPLGKVFAETDIQSGSSWSVTTSHELLEMLGDPDVNLTAFVQDSDTSGILYAYETCDACEADELGYKIDGVLVSDFVYPAWFESFRTKGPFDKQGKISKPFQLLPGGYIGIFNVTRGGGWTQIFGNKGNYQYEMRPRVGSRREKRRTPREYWLKSKRS